LTPSPLLSPLSCRAALLLLVLASYSNSFTVGFPLDNKQLILQDPRVHDATAANVELILQHSYWWPYGESGLYRPLTTLSYLANYAALGNGPRPFGYHVVNIALHIVNVWLVFALVRRVTGPHVVSGFSRTGDVSDVVSGFSRTVTAFAAAAIWAVHPLGTEAVTNIVGRSDLIATFGVLAALLMYLRSGDAAGSTRVLWLAGVMAATACGVFAKETAIVIPAVVALYEITWWSGRRSAMSLATAAAAMALPVALMLSQRSAVLGASPTAEFAFTDNPIAGAGFLVGRLTAVNVMARYLGRIVWPATLSADYSYAQIPLARGAAADWIACAVVGFVAVAAAVAYRRCRPAFFFAAFAFVTFLPVSNLLFATGTIMAERLMYLPSIGVIGAVASAFGFAARRSAFRTTVAIAAALVVAGFGVRTWTRNPVWRDDLTLWQSTVRTSPLSAKAHRAFAEALYDVDPAHRNIDAVIDEAERSVVLLAPVPDDENSFQSFRQAGAYYLDKRDKRQYPRALTLLQRALAIVRAGSAKITGASREPEADVQRLLAATYLGLDDPAAALEAATQARALGPLQPLAYRLAADALLALRRPNDSATTLMAGSMITSDASLGRDLVGLYRSGLDEQGCAVAKDGSDEALNPNCPIVHAHACTASVDAIAVTLALGRRDQAARLKEAAIGGLGCQPEPLEQVFPRQR
jgi:hypothetical protein